jgi:hypothetical protein
VKAAATDVPSIIMWLMLEQLCVFVDPGNQP